MSDELKKQIKCSCKFNNLSYEIIEGYLRIVEHTNLAYVEPHKVIIDNKLYLFFNEQNYSLKSTMRNIKILWVKEKIFGNDFVEQKQKIKNPKYLLK